MDASPTTPELTPCRCCGELASSEYATRKNGWPEDDSFLPGAAQRLELVRDLDPHGGRTRHLQRCPMCGAWFLYRTDYTFLAGGTEDEEFLDRIDAAEAARLLGG